MKPAITPRLPEGSQAVQGQGALAPGQLACGIEIPVSVPSAAGNDRSHQRNL